jgi:predicted nucleotidyltransferase
MLLWEITEEKVQSAVRRIVEVSNPVSVVLFGSYTREQVGPNSDVDILVVVEDCVENCRQESVRIRKALKGISMPMDIIVVRRRDLKKFSDAPGMIYASALKEGKVVYEKAA